MKTKNKFKAVRDYFFSPKKNLQLILFNIISIASFVGGIMVLVISVCNPDFRAVILPVLSLILLVVFSIYQANVRGRIFSASIITVSVSSFVVMPVIFFFGGGAHSGVHLWFELALIFNFLIFQGKTFLIIFVLQNITFIVCYWINYKFPNLVTHFSSEFNYYLDVYNSLLLVSCILGLINKFQRKIYYSAINDLENQKTVLSESEQRAEAANRAKSDFLSNMSHEIRTPINAIIGMNEMILRESKDKKIVEYAQAIQGSSSALLSIINDVLDISKIESGKLALVDVDYNLSELISDCHGLVAPRFDKKSLKLNINCDANLPKGLHGDSVRIRQIVVNFLTNAVKYTEKGKVDFSITGLVAGDELMLSFSVKDQGIGIKDEDKERLFSKFERFDMQRNRNIEGTGLGLNLSKQLADLMNGRIEVKSVYGLGSEFSLIVPQKIWDNSPVGLLNVAKKEVKKVQVYHQNFEAPEAKILAVDDMELNLIVLENLLKETKMQIDLAESGAECLKKTAVKHYDLIFMDHMMPEMNGIQTLEKLKESETPNKETPVIVLTANALSGARNEYLEKGFVDYLSKPIDPKSIEEMLMKYLPPEKVHKNNVEEEAECNEKIKVLRNLLPEFDYELALSYCDDSDDLCVDIITDWCSEDHSKNLELYFDSQAWENYRLELHSLKSTAKTVGLPELAEKFRIIESALKKGDRTYALQNHESVISQYIKSLDKMRDAGFVK